MQRRKSRAKPDRKPPTARKRRSVKAEEEILALVRTAVEGFLLDNATFEEFLAILHAVEEKEEEHSHQLAIRSFSRIVKDVFQKRGFRKQE